LKPRVYDSWGVYSEYVIGFSGATFQSYSTMMQAEEAFVAFLEHQNELQKAKQVTQKVEDVAKKWCWKNWVILVQFVVITVLWYKIT
jgi:viroplasmin and RNaseH domain-containing protein